MTWKFLWQFVFILGLSLFILMVVKFSIGGFREIIEILRKKND